VDMGDEAGLDTTDLRFVIEVRDKAHLDAGLRNLGRTASVLRTRRVLPASS
jgi:guanosine-3',5'-bis(diphosphate) 3'-pyrophosphohydrolase